MASLYPKIVTWNYALDLTVINPIIPELWYCIRVLLDVDNVTSEFQVGIGVLLYVDPIVFDIVKDIVVDQRLTQATFLFNLPSMAESSIAIIYYVIYGSNVLKLMN